MLRVILVQNRQGKSRLLRWFKGYNGYNGESQDMLRAQIHQTIVRRDSSRQSNIFFQGALTVVYRRYAGLYFCACIDRDDNPHAALEALHTFVEALDATFQGVCELDLIFHWHRTLLVLDEVFQGGYLIEWNKPVICERVAEIEQVAPL